MNFIRFSFGFPFLNQFDDISACAKVFTWWNWNDTEERRDAIRVGHDDNDELCGARRDPQNGIDLSRHGSSNFGDDKRSQIGANCQ